MDIPIYQVDAFSAVQFKGNPAAVCPLESWLPEDTLQAIAAENNLAETAFFVAEGNRFRLRWFTPAIEVPLCGHATLATAHVLFKHLNFQGDRIAFDSASGELVVTRENGLLWLNFPSRPAGHCDPHPRLVDGLGTQPLEVLGAQYYLVVYRNEEEVRTLQPNMEVLAHLDKGGIVVTAPGIDVDFVSRFFAPAMGVPEDPVTGSAHCTLIPYWSRRLGKKEMRARQISPRTGELWVEDRLDRVRMGGHAADYLRGVITVG